ncbi:MAG: hypothetical protein ACE5IR_26250 [bacterium]
MEKISQNPGERHEEKILLSAYHAAADLKAEIGRRILQRSNSQWEFVRLISRGAFLYLIFKPRI